LSFLVDTDICSAFLRGPGHLFHRFSQHAGQLHISVISLGELFSWTLRRQTSPKYQAGLQSLLQDVSLIGVDLAITRRFGEIRAALLDQGKAAPLSDLFIAAIALVNNWTVVTHNVQDFASIPGLRVDDWLVP
jgi:tRNA(fMet)-specific endonuclease VapC